MKTVGRPTKYNEETVKKTQKYFDSCRASGSMPFIEELALELDVNDDTIVEWSKNNEEFSAAVSKVKLLQKLSLKKGALSKQLQPTTAIFLLKVNHGMNEEEKKDKDPVDGFHIHLVGNKPTNLEDALVNKKTAIEDLEKAEKAIADFSKNSS